MIKIEYIIRIFNSWAFNGPEYFPKVEGTALYVLLPKANSRAVPCTKYSGWSFDCSGKKRLFYYQIKCSYLNITESFHTIMHSDHCKSTLIIVYLRYLCSKEILGNFLYF